MRMSSKVRHTVAVRDRATHRATRPFRVFDVKAEAQEYVRGLVLAPGEYADVSASRPIIWRP